ncbi:glycosyltransferase [Formosa sp. 4Alg 33]|uniref:glycosyltransferase n=1 Tax=Formosa sp. 4Alg 33 TaxID=3382189 RepID=UPI003D9C1581
MKPLLINTSDIGGAANACIRLHTGLLGAETDSKLLLKEKTRDNIPNSYKVSITTLRIGLRNKLTKKSRVILNELGFNYRKKNNDFFWREPGLELCTNPWSDYDLTSSKLVKEADLINLHWVPNFIDYKSFFKKTDKPVVWTLHDQNPFLGFEHYQETIIGMDSKGYPITRSISKKERDLNALYLKLKKDALSKIDNLHIVTLCNWMYEEVNHSELFGNFKSYIIPNGIDSEKFKALNKEHCRELLNIPNDKIVFLFVSDSVNNKRKGFAFLEKALKLIDREDIFLLSVGNKNSTLIQDDKLNELGYIHDELLMSIIYSAADAFIIPSLMDNLPNTAIESLLCGTPVLGFPVGGLKDIVQHNENGLLAEEISVPALTNILNIFFENSHKFDSKIIRDNAIKKYDISVQVQNYLRLYKTIIG